MILHARTIASLAALALVAAPAPTLAASVVLTASLTSETTPGSSATFRVEADPALGDFCYILSFKGLGTVKDAVIVETAAVAEAKPLVTMEVTGVETDMCMAVEPKVLEPIVAEPGKYQVVVRSAAAPQGAVRGVLVKP